MAIFLAWIKNRPQSINYNSVMDKFFLRWIDFECAQSAH